MTAYLVRRLLLVPLLLLAISFIVFVLLRAVHGDAAKTIAGEKASAEEIERVRRERGFDRPVLVQYAIYLGRLLRGDLGISYKSKEPVTSEIGRMLPPTIELTFGAMALATVGGLFLGILSAVYKGSWIDYTTMTVALAGVSIPVFWLGLLMILAFGSVFPTLKNYSVLQNYDPVTGFVLLDSLFRGQWTLLGDALRHLVLPAAALATIPIAITARITRSSMLEVLGSDYIRTARAKGVSPQRVIVRHGLRNALIPIVTLVGLEFGYLLGGAILTERVFTRNGMGTYILDSITGTEHDSVAGAVLVLAVMFVLVNLAVDVLYAFIDPRIRYAD